MKKRLISLLMAALCALLPLTAPAEDAAYASTQAALTALRDIGLEPDVMGVDDSGSERVAVEMAEQQITIELTFDAEQQHCALRAAEVFTFEAHSLGLVLRCCNDLNAEYRFVRFFVAEDGLTVTAAMDVSFRGDAAGDVTLEAMERFMSILEEAAPVLYMSDKE